jgi:cytochrome c biogenesis protein CcdA
MATQTQSPPDVSLATLTSGILHDVQELIKHQLNLFRHEVEVKTQKTAAASACLVAGIVLLAVSVAFLAATLVAVLHEVETLPWWASCLIIGGILVALGGGLTFFGVQRLRSINPIPEETSQALQENLEWTNNPK